MKKILLLFLAILAANVLQAGVVTEQQALQKAQQFMKGKKFQKSPLPRMSAGDGTTGPSYYVFNADNKAGFVIVSADDRTDAILGYSDSGEMDIAKLPSNVKAWLDGYDRQIKALGDSKMGSAPRMSNAAIPHLIKTQWSQHEPYNLQCPIDPESNNRCITGCVATAMAQVLNYYKYPREVLPAVPAYDVNDNFHVDALEGTTINWENMRLTYDGSDTDEAAQEVARLMRYCGQLVEMKYGPTGSGAATNAILSLKNWGYTENASMTYRNDYNSQDEWENRIYEELQAGRPVLYSADNDQGGHQFICDGYDGEGHFHINWGWGGYCDGHFLLSVLNPYSNNGWYTYDENDNYVNQDAIINLQPRDGSMPEIGEEGTEFDATTIEGIPMHFVITYDTSSKRTCSVSRNLSDGSYRRAIDTDYDGPVTIPSEVEYNGKTFTVTEIGDNAFEDCMMASLTIAPTIKRIGSYAISWCYQLSSLEIPASVTSISSYALQYTDRQLTSLTVAAENSKYDSRNNCNAIIETESNKLVLGTIGTTIPNTVTEIGESAFQGINGLRITIPATVSVIGRWAFAGCNAAILTANYTAAELSTITVADNAFDDAGNSNMVLKVPAGTKNTYHETTGWSVFPLQNIYEGDEGTEFTATVNGVEMTFTITSDTSNKRTAKVGHLSGSWSNNAIDRSTRQAVITIPKTVTYNNAEYTVTAIGDYAFCNMWYIEQLKMPETIETIGNYAITQCDRLTAIEIPAKVASLGDNLFRNCSSLTSLIIAADNPVYESRGCNVIIEKATNTLIQGTKVGTIPSGVEVIGAYAFSNFEGLNLTIPASVTSIGDNAFGWCYGSVFIVESATPLAIDEDVFDGAGENNCVLRVPAGAKAVYLQAVGWRQFGEANIFEGSAGLEFTEDVTVGEDVTISMAFTVTSDGDSKEVKVGRLAGSWENTAVSQATTITAIKVPETVTHEGTIYTVTAIGAYAFYDIEMLEQLELPATITSIGDYAFSDCYNLKGIEIPANVTQIGSSVFEYCNSLVSLTVAADNAYFEAPDGCNALIEKQSHKLIMGTKGTTTIPSTVTEIGDNAFEDIGDLKLTIPKTVKKIGSYAFAWCNGAVFKVEYDAGELSTINVADDAFYGASGANAILKVPTGTRDAYLAATGWNRFKPENVLEGSMGEEFTEKMSVKIRDNNTGDLVDGETDMTFTVTGSDGTYQTVKVGALNGSYSNTAINESLTDGSEIEIPEFITHEGVIYRITAIGDYAFCYKSFFKKITLPNSVTSIGNNAFQQCHGLTEFVIPKSVTAIGNYVFRWVSSVTLSVEEGNSVYDSRDNCNAVIETATNTLLIGTCATKAIPSSVTAIGDYAFYNLNDIELTIPQKINNIGYYAFAYCQNSTFIVESNIPATISEWAFDGAQNYNIILKVPAGCKEAYLAAIGWNQFQRANVYEGNEGEEFTETVNGIDMTFTVTNASEANPQVKLGYRSKSDAAISQDIEGEVVIPATVNHKGVTYQVSAIGSYAFNNVYMSSVTLPETITEIGEYAFSYCYNLTAIKIPASVVNICKYAFAANRLTSITVDAGNQVYSSPNQCNAVIETASGRLVVGTRSTVIPSGEIQIASGAFCNIVNLAITIPENVSYIEDGAFNWCYNLTVTVESESPLAISEDAFYGVEDEDTNSKLRVPTGSKNAYLTALGWSSFLSDHVIEYDSDVILGDANGDKSVDVMDVVLTVDYILNRQPANFVFKAADVNQDNVIDVTDVVGIVNIILHNNSGSNARSKDGYEDTANDRLSLVQNEDGLSLCLDNQAHYVAAQFDLKLTDGQLLENVLMNDSRSRNHQVAYAELEKNCYRVLIYAVGNNVFQGSQGELVRFRLGDGAGNAEVSHIRFVTSRGETKEFDSLYYVSTDVNRISQANVFDIYSTSGALLRRNATSTEGLKKGVYIINNHKIVIK